MVNANSMNQNSSSSGLWTWDGDGGSDTTGLVQYNTLAGASENTIQNIAPGAAGKVYTSNGVGAYPSFQDPADGTVTFTGDTGTPFTNHSVSFLTNLSTNKNGATLFFFADNILNQIDLFTTDENINICYGLLSGNTSLVANGCVYNNAFGGGTLQFLTSGGYNAAFAQSALAALVTGSNNSAFGTQSLASLISGSLNSSFGFQSLLNITTGSFNTCFGEECGKNYTTSESSNILLANMGVVGESNVMRLGTHGSGDKQVNKCFVAGIVGNSVGGSPVYCDANGQLSLGSGGSGSWIDEGASFAAIADNGYIVTATATATLPASPIQGDTIQFFVDSVSGILTIQASGSQTIQSGPNVSGAGGTATNYFNGDSITLVYRAANTNWFAISRTGSWLIT